MLQLRATIKGRSVRYRQYNNTYKKAFGGERSSPLLREEPTVLNQITQTIIYFFVAVFAAVLEAIFTPYFERL